MIKKITLPIEDNEIKKLHAGDIVSISGEIFAARDAAHKRIYDAIRRGEKLPVEFRGKGIYYMGPAPAPPGGVIGSCGPTSSYRMDKFTPTLIEHGLKVMVGKGERSQAVIDSIKKHCAVYFAATGGAAALIAKFIAVSKVIAYEDLGTEAIRQLVLRDFIAIVAIDCYGVNQYREGPEAFLKNQNCKEENA